MYENGIHHPWFRCPWAPQMFNIVWGSHPVMFAGSWTNLNSRSPALLSATQMAKGKRSLKAARCWRQRKCIPRPLAMQCLGGDHVRFTTHGIGFYMYICREPMQCDRCCRLFWSQWTYIKWIWEFDIFAIWESNHTYVCHDFLTHWVSLPKKNFLKFRHSMG
jgi:hypothetical protein